MAQFALGMVALGRQLYALGLTDTDRLSLNSGAVTILMDMYQVKVPTPAGLSTRLVEAAPRDDGTWR